MTHDPRPREDDVENYMRKLEALGFSDRVARSRDEAMVWQWQDEIRDQPTHEQLLKLLARVREDERRKIDLQHERETNDLLRKILTRREEILSESWQREREENLRRIAELETKQFKLWHK